MSILDTFDFDAPQRRAATSGGHVAVTAGAGSGKTRTLVGRYLHHLESGLPLQTVIAITFTEKAAREMQTRIRQAIIAWLEQDPPRRTDWETILADMDAAYIGTIHSLCARILRTHPVEAARLGVRPGFGVLEEGRAAVLRARAVEEGLAWAAQDNDASHLFRLFSEHRLRELITVLMEKRLDAGPMLTRPEIEAGDDLLAAWADQIWRWLSGPLEAPAWKDSLAELANLAAETPDDPMEQARRAVLTHARALEEARRQRDVAMAIRSLAALRQATSLKGRKANWPGETLNAVRACMRLLRAHFDTTLSDLVSPKNPPVWALDGQLARQMPTLRATYRQALRAYESAKAQENSLDFDDLEERALALLRRPPVRVFWQERASAVLVDEFQDTNDRQREIIYTLAGFAANDDPASQGPPASLFIVGDGKQSIYRFRGADVTVFRRVQRDIERAGGQVISLDRTFRAHRALVAETNRLLAPIMGEEEQPDRPYRIPFTPLEAYRDLPRTGILPPFVEFHLGVGENATQGRHAAAEGLVTRLRQLHAAEGVEWQDVALLFRASTTFPIYEEALERAGIPFVTVAGRGFYDRPEVRDLLNALRAIADPTDDLALTGLLRSPAIGLSDAVLYALRFPHPSSQPVSLWAMLHHPGLPDLLTAEDLARAIQARELLETLHDLAGRVPVAVLLKQWLDHTSYRALLRLSGGTRALRNVDKLLADAHLSGLVSVFEFDEYVRTLRDVGGRESEAPSEAGQAIQLMTVHKAKGLEFPVVVIAAAAHGGRGQVPSVLLDDMLGVAVDLRDNHGCHPVLHRLAALRERERQAAESDRLLYVAATRAREKLLVSGYTKIRKGGHLSLAGWLNSMGDVIHLAEVTMDGVPTEPHTIPLSPSIRCVLHPYTGATARTPDRPTGSEEPLPLATDLVAPLVAPPLPAALERRRQEAEPPPRVWRVVPTVRRPAGPAWVVGHLVHAALRCWRFPHRPGLESFLRPFALEAGLTDEQEIHNTIAIARRLLSRFQAHPLYAALDRAQRRHELPYMLMAEGIPRSGIVDLLAYLDGVWTVVEFKTDELRAGADLAAHSREQGYDEQVREYVAAVADLLGEIPHALLVYLNVGGRIAVLDLTDGRIADCGP